MAFKEIAQPGENGMLTPRLSEFLLFFLLFFTTQMSFREVDLTNRAVDLQVIIRLLVLGGIFVSCLPWFGVFLKASGQIHIFLHVALLFYLCLVSLSATHFNSYSYYGLATHMMMFYIVCCFVYRFGVNNTLYYYFVSVVIFCAICIIYYYAFPSIGRYTYWERGVIFQSLRMQGISGHPNTLGLMTATALLVFMHMKLNRFPLGRLLPWFSLLIAACLVLTQSRTNLGALGVGCGLYLTLRMRSFPFLGIIIPGVAFFVLFFWNVLSKILSVVSRSGNASEITTFTGRTHIWGYIYSKFLEKPFFGWGHGTVSSLLANNAGEVGFTVGQAHSLYLQMLFVGGVIGFSLFSISMITAMFCGVKAGRHLSTCLVLFIMLVGTTETIILSTVANNAYLVFAMTLFCIGAPLTRSLFVHASRPAFSPALRTIQP